MSPLMKQILVITVLSIDAIAVIISIILMKLNITRKETMYWIWIICTVSTLVILGFLYQRPDTTKMMISFLGAGLGMGGIVYGIYIFSGEFADFLPKSIVNRILLGCCGYAIGTILWLFLAVFFVAFFGFDKETVTLFNLLGYAMYAFTGFYNITWARYTMVNIRYLNDEDLSCIRTGEAFLFILVFPYWVYTRSQKLYNICKKYGAEASDKSIINLILSFIPLLGMLIVLCLMQYDLNKVLSRNIKTETNRRSFDREAFIAQLENNNKT